MRSLLKNTLLYLFYLTSLWKLIRAKNANKIPILMYHGITEDRLPIWTQIQKKEFELQMGYLHKNYKIISLDQAIDAIREKKKLPPFSAVVTFDDGFKNNFTTAYPILKKYGAPATIFLTTSFIDRVNEFDGLIWTDFIMALLLETKKKSIIDPFSPTTIIQIETTTDKIQAKEYLCSELKNISYSEKNGIVQKLRLELEVSFFSKKTDLFKGLRWDEIRQMDNEGLIAFGSHTKNHEILSRIATDKLEDEICYSKQIIENYLKHSVNSFAYPNGRPCDYDERALALVKNNYRGAVSTIEGLSSLSDDVFQLKRLPVGNDTLLWQFKLHLAGTYEIFHSFIRH